MTNNYWLITMSVSMVYKMMGITLSSDLSHIAQVMYGVAPDLPQPLPRGPDRAEKERDTQIQTQIQIGVQVCREQNKTVKDKRKDVTTNKNLISSACFLPLCWQSAEYTFMGSLIIREVIKDLVPRGIKQAKVVLLSGTR